MKRSGHTGSSGAGGIVPALLLVMLVLLCARAGRASDQADGQTQDVQHGSALRPAWTGSGDVDATFNPLGIDLSGGLGYRDPYRVDAKENEAIASWETGASVDLTPSYVQPSLYFEWMPVPFFVGRVQYDWYSYFGTNGSLLSFPSAAAPFGDHEQNALKGDEQTGTGTRILLQPTFQAKIGDLVMRNQSDIARYRFPGSGPFYLVQEYDTLLPDKGRLFANRTQVLRDWESSGRRLLIGPYYELVQGAAGTRVRRQIGLLFYSESGPRAGDHEHHYVAQIGYNLTDRNREGEIYLLIGLGFSSLLK